MRRKAYWVYFIEGEDMKYFKAYKTILAAITSIFLLFFPFITYLHVREPKGMELTYFAKKSKIMLDMFLYYKEMALFFFAIFLMAALMFGAVVYWVVLEKPPLGWRKEKPVFFALGVYFLLNLVSVLLSEYKEYGYLGNGIDYEGLAAVFAYLVLFAAGYFLFAGNGASNILLIVLRVLMSVLIAGTFLEAVYGPIMNIECLQSLIIPKRYAHLLEYWFLKGYDDISLTFSNPGFFGGFCGMLLPIGVGLAFTEERKSAMAADMLLSGGMLFCIILSGSSGALYGAVGASFLEIVFLCWRNQNSRVKMCVRFTLILICTGMLLYAAQVAENIQTAADEGTWNSGFLKNIMNEVESSVINEQYEKGDMIFEAEKIWLNEGTLYIQGKDAALTVRAAADVSEMTVHDYLFTDGNGKKLEVQQEGRLTGDYERVRVSAEGRILTVDLGYRDPVCLYAEKGSLYYIDFNGSLLSRIPQPALPQLERFYPLFTGRGYIWISSLPILKDVIVLGKGIGSFPFVYGQSEVAGMLNVHGSADYCIEQAHSWYLQTAVSSGLVSLLCMLYVFGRTLKKGLERQLCREKSISQWKDLLIWGLLAYMVTGIVNNSCIAAAPMFWLLLGVMCRTER